MLSCSNLQDGPLWKKLKRFCKFTNTIKYGVNTVRNIEWNIKSIVNINEQLHI